MYQNVTYIVGNNFSTFAQLDNVFTIAEAINLVDSSNPSALSHTMCVIGQGVSKAEKEQLQYYSRKNKLGMIANNYRRHASHELTHKHKHENIMITEPLIIKPAKLYRAYLATDDACAEMNDHQTGQHIQGMVLTEAARQMAIAVAERFILQENEQGNSYCVLKTVNSSYLQFAFPVDIKIEHEIFSNKKDRAAGYEVKTQTRFIQNEFLITTVDIEYSLHNKKIFSLLEKQLAEKTIRTNSAQQLDNSYIDMAA